MALWVTKSITVRKTEIHEDKRLFSFCSEKLVRPALISGMTFILWKGEIDLWATFNKLMNYKHFAGRYFETSSCK